MAIRCIALDLDRTTLNEAGKLSEGNHRALLYAMERGVQIVIASGRALSSLPEEVLRLPGLQYAITSNGAAVYHVPTGKCLLRYVLTEQSVGEILRLTAGEDVVYETFIHGTGYADANYVRDPAPYGASLRAVAYVQRTRRPVEDIVGFIRENSFNLDSLDVIVRDADTKARLWAMLQDSIEDIYVTSSIPRLLEISHRDAGKHSGLRFIRELLGLAPEETAAFGDEDNDLGMLREAGIGIAVANASEACKAVADWVTGDYREDGVAQGIYRLLEMEE